MDKKMNKNEAQNKLDEKRMEILSGVIENIVNGSNELDKIIINEEKSYRSVLLEEDKTNNEFFCKALECSTSEKERERIMESWELCRTACKREKEEEMKEERLFKENIQRSHNECHAKFLGYTTICVCAVSGVAIKYRKPLIDLTKNVSKQLANKM